MPLAAEIVEVPRRGWHTEGQAVRPAHHILAHTGFFTKARRTVLFAQLFLLSGCPRVRDAA